MDVRLYKDRWLPKPMPSVLSARVLEEDVRVVELVQNDGRWKEKVM